MAYLVIGAVILYLLLTSRYVANYLVYRIWSNCKHCTWGTYEMPSPSSAMWYYLRQCPECGASEWYEFPYKLIPFMGE
jgi:hypothetical protein